METTLYGCLKRRRKLPFRFYNSEIPEVILVEPVVFNDERGFFMESYKHAEFINHGIKDKFVQDNHSCSFKCGVIRGLHFQKKAKAQAKLVKVIMGKILDVAVDIRLGSPTYGKWVAVELSAENKKMLYIPEGFAHGFCVLSDNSEVIYKCSNEYSPEYDRGIIWNDKDIGIGWPFKQVILSERDSYWPGLTRADSDFTYEN